MGSTFTTFPGKYDQTSIAGTKKKLPVYVQFVPGVVVKVATGLDSITSEGVSKKIGSIIAMPHFGEKGVAKPSLAGEEFRYYPLLRGIQEVPTPGDPVLLCTFGGIQYYMGPLNTEGNPNFNTDSFKNTGASTTVNDTVYSEGNIETPLFQKGEHARLQKLLNPELDAPWIAKSENPEDYIGPKQFVSDTIHGDLVLEGRHGNSLRIGSRDVNPYIIISNGREEHNPVETSLDGSIFGMFQHGSLRQHFNMDHKYDGTESKKYPFTLADDEKDTVHRSISKTFTTALGRGLGRNKKYSNPDATYDGEDDPDIVETLYNYNKDQLFASSGRITFNARSDSMFLASHKFIHFGAGDNITFSTSKTFLVNAATSMVVNSYGLFKVHAAGEVYIDGRQKITLGNPAKEEDGGYGDVVHPAVLGYGLMSQLVLIVEEIKKLAYSVSAAVENKDEVGGSLDVMQKHVDAFDDIMGAISKMKAPSGVEMVVPENLAEMILSKNVFIKV